MTDLNEMLEVKELLHTNDVNRHIKMGWKLIDTCRSSGTDKAPVITYCVGRPKSAENIKKSKRMPEQKKSNNRSDFIYSL